MKYKQLKPGEIEVINIGKDAIFEWLCESMIEHTKHFFDVKDCCDVHFHCDWDIESNQFTCVIESNNAVDGKQVFHDFNFSVIREKVGETTDSLFSNERLYHTLNFQKDPLLVE